MVETNPPVDRPSLARIEPEHRLVVLARTINVEDAGAEIALEASVLGGARYGQTCLGRALYRHGAIFRNASAAPVWSHLELSYFRHVVPGDVIRDLVSKPQSAGINLLRAEILLTSPSSFVLPSDWQGMTDRPGRQASLEYIHVEPSFYDEYRNVMRDYCGPAAAKLVRAGRFGTFRAMETAVVLHHDAGLKIDWNQIHLCELETDGFQGFGREFEAALRAGSPGAADTSSVFAGLDRMRTVPRWTFNDCVVEEDAALAQTGRTEI